MTTASTLWIQVIDRSYSNQSVDNGLYEGLAGNQTYDSASGNYTAFGVANITRDTIVYFFIDHDCVPINGYRECRRGFGFEKSNTVVYLGRLELSTCEFSEA